MRIALFARTHISPSRLAAEGLGGSESSAVYLMSALAQRGHEVTVYSVAEAEQECGRVAYRNIAAYRPGAPTDVLILFREAHPFLVDNSRACIKLFWITDVPYSRFLPVDFSKLDRVICMSPFHSRTLLAFYPYLPAEKLRILELGIVRDDYYIDTNLATLPPKRGNLLIYCSAPHRGLGHLSRLFPRIRTKVADAELVITSDYSLWGLQPGTESYRKLFEGAEGVNYLGKAPRAELVHLQKASKAMAYPCVYAEGFCISAMECIAAGAVPVTTHYGALATTVADSGVLLSGCPGQQCYDDAFVDAVVRLLTDDSYRISLSEKGRRRAMHEYTWESVADRFEELLRECR